VTRSEAYRQWTLSDPRLVDSHSLGPWKPGEPPWLEDIPKKKRQGLTTGNLMWFIACVSASGGARLMAWFCGWCTRSTVLKIKIGTRVPDGSEWPSGLAAPENGRCTSCHYRRQERKTARLFGLERSWDILARRLSAAARPAQQKPRRVSPPGLNGLQSVPR